MASEDDGSQSGWGLGDWINNSNHKEKANVTLCYDTWFRLNTVHSITKWFRIQPPSICICWEVYISVLGTDVERGVVILVLKAGARMKQPKVSKAGGRWGPIPSLYGDIDGQPTV